MQRSPATGRGILLGVDGTLIWSDDEEAAAMSGSARC